MYFIYAISSVHDNFIYVGMTQNVEKRVKQHNLGQQRSIKPHKPFKLIFVETIDGTRKEARIREKYWKSGIGKEKLRILKDKN